MQENSSTCECKVLKNYIIFNCFVTLKSPMTSCIQLMEVFFFNRFRFQLPSSPFVSFLDMSEFLFFIFKLYNVCSKDFKARQFVNQMRSFHYIMWLGSVSLAVFHVNDVYFPNTWNLNLKHTVNCKVSNIILKLILM